MKITEFDSELRIETRPGLTHVLLTACVPLLGWGIATHCLTQVLTVQDRNSMILAAMLLLIGILVSNNRQVVMLDRENRMCRLRRAKYGVIRNQSLPLTSVVQARYVPVQYPGEQQELYQLVMETLVDPIELSVGSIASADQAAELCDRINGFMAGERRVLMA